MSYLKSLLVTLLIVAAVAVIGVVMYLATHGASWIGALALLLVVWGTVHSIMNDREEDWEEEWHRLNDEVPS